MTGNLSLLIQGPLHRATVENIKRNSPLVHQCVVSTWNAQDAVQAQILLELRHLETTIDNLKVIVSELDLPKIPHIDRGGMQFMSIENGLKHVLTSQVIKCRSDEEYELSKFLLQLGLNPNRTVFSNFIVRDWLYHPFHISDHLFASPTHLLNEVLERISSRTPAEIDSILGTHSKTPEVVLGYHLLEAHEHADSPHLDEFTPSFKLFSKHFSLFNLEQLDFYSVNANQAGIQSLMDIRSLRSFRSEEGYRLNFHLYKRTSQLRPARLKATYTRQLKPILRAISLKLAASISRMR
jgi:hypothetical protein